MRFAWYNISNNVKFHLKENINMNRITTLNTKSLCSENVGCGECQTSCQSACKTSCGIANQKCESKVSRIKTLVTKSLCSENGGCGECQTSCQSACKTSCGIANQSCEK